MNTLIGIFDSGLGGLSVWSEVVRLMPNQATIYYADAANCPYGGKTADEIYRLTEKGVRWLINKGAKIIIIACNTATGAAIEKLRMEYSNIPFIGMEPAIKKAVETTENGNIGILATKFTLHSKKYLNTKAKYASGSNVYEKEGEGLVEIVEKGEMESNNAEALLRKHITPMLNANIDTLVLGCTHYPFLTKKIKEITGSKVRIIDPAPFVVKHAIQIMSERGILPKENTTCKSYRFHSTLSAAHSHYIRKRAFDLIKNG